MLPYSIFNKYFNANASCEHKVAILLNFFIEDSYALDWLTFKITETNISFWVGYSTLHTIKHSLSHLLWGETSGLELVRQEFTPVVSNVHNVMW